MQAARAIMCGIDGLAQESHLTDWYQCFECLGDDEEAGGHLFARLSHKRYEQIAIILGLPIDDRSTLFSTFFWHPISIGIAESTSALLEMPAWQVELDKVLPL